MTLYTTKEPGKLCIDILLEYDIDSDHMIEQRQIGTNDGDVMTAYFQAIQLFSSSLYLRIKLQSDCIMHTAPS